MKKRILKISLSILLLLILAGLWIGMLAAYKSNFCKRFTTYEPKKLYIEDYTGLSRTRYQFKSNKGQTLTGYLYKIGNDTKKGIVVVAHGFSGGGHNSYMDCINHFAKNGYFVFAYDATGNDESEGLGKDGIVGGMPQGVIDLDHAISFIEDSGNFPVLPIMLFGHSWGGFSVSSVLAYHPEVKAVAEVAGFNTSVGMFEAGGKKVAGGAVKLFLPFYVVFEAAKYGKYAFASGVKGFKASDAKIMVIHSKNDTTVPPSYGYNIYYKKFKDNPRFTFVLSEDKGHSFILRSQKGIDYINDFNEKFDEYFSSLDYDYKDKKNQERFIKEKAEYLNKNIDREIWCHTPNEELLDQIVAMYDEVSE